MFRPIVRPTRPVFLPNPVNWQHPLNRGRLAWWQCLPGRMAGPTWYDLCGRNNATLISMGASTRGWESNARPGGSGSMLFDATTSTYVSCPVTVQPTTAVSLQCWVNPISWTATGLEGVACFPAGTSNLPYFGWLYYSGFGGFAFQIYAGGTRATYHPGNPAVGVWTHCMATWDGANVSTYLNGVLKTGPSAYTGTIPAVSSGVIGALQSYNYMYSGYVDDVSFWNRALSAAEVQADYELSMRGYPGVLNRWTWPRYAAATSAYNARLGSFQICNL